MKAITVVPGISGQVRVEEIDEPSPQEGEILVEGRLLGVCGTDAEVVAGGHGMPPPGRDRLVIGHESLGVVLEAPAYSGLAAGDLVGGMVRYPDPVPCGPCARGEQDFCRNGRYTERGIKERDGFGAQRWRVDLRQAVRLDPALGDLGVLVEPASVLAKAWEQIDRIFARSPVRPQTALITGAGPVGLLAALLAAQRGLRTHVLDRSDTGPKPHLVADLGAHFHTGDVPDIGIRPDVVIECTGDGALIAAVTELVMPAGVVCLAGISSRTQTTRVALEALATSMVMGNVAVFGTVNAGRRNYEQAAEALAKADPHWLARMITRRVPMDGFADALDRGPEDVKVVVDLQAA